MDIEEIRHGVRSQATRTGRLVSQTRIGVVDGVQPDRHAVRVRLQPDDVLTGWLPMMALSVGNGWGLHALPKLGAQVVVGFQEGSVEDGVVLGALFSEAQSPPPNVPVGAVWLYSESGARVQLNTDGSVDILAAVIRIGAVGATFKKLVMDTFRPFFDAHTHQANNGPPVQKMQDSHLTTNLTAS